MIHTALNMDIYTAKSVEYQQKIITLDDIILYYNFQHFQTPSLYYL